MSHYPDLSPYSYDESPRAMLNVGWLHPQHGYATGVVDERVVQALVILSSAYENQMRGFHRCEFCDTDRVSVSVSGGPNGDTRVWLGSAEIRVTGRTEPSTPLRTWSSTTSPRTATARPRDSAVRRSERRDSMRPDR